MAVPNPRTVEAKPVSKKPVLTRFNKLGDDTKLRRFGLEIKFKRFGDETRFNRLGVDINPPIEDI